VLRRSVVPWVLLVVVAAALGWQRVAGDASDGSASPSRARVVRVVDGDTILVSVGGGRQERVRYIGVDTPESVKPGTPVQCYAKRASAFNKKLLTGRSVRLVQDAEARDRYGRLLAYVYREPDGLFVNAEIARGGYARTLTIPPNVKFAARFRALAAAAQDAGRGLWSACER
jgi:micrococcal nuclease